MSKFQEGEDVYVIGFGEIIEGWIDECITIKNTKTYIIKSYDSEFFTVSEKDIFTTEEEAKIELEKYIQNRIDAYKLKIMNVHDLVTFPLTIDFDDKYAQQAYRIRAKELLGY